MEGWRRELARIMIANKVFLGLVGFLLLVNLSFVAGQLRGQESGRVMIPSTRISLVPPPCYKLLEKSQILYCQETGAMLTIVESPNPVAVVLQSYADSTHLADLNFEAISRPEAITIDGVPGMKFNIRRRSGLLTDQTEIFRVFVAGDSLGAFTAIVSYHDSVSAEVAEPLVESVSTIRWSHERSLTPMDVLRFSISTPSGLQLAHNEARWRIYTTDGTINDQDYTTSRFALALVRGPSSLEYLQEDGRKRMMEAFIDNVDANIKISQVVEFNKLLLDGVPTYETISSGKWKRDGNPVTVYYTVIFHPGDLITMVGITHSDQDINAFKAAARSFKRTTTRVDDLIKCASLLHSGRLSEAGGCCNQALMENPDSVSARLVNAEVLRLEGSYDFAVGEYSHVLEIEKFCEEALLGRARSYAAKKEWSEAIRDFDIALELDDSNATGHMERGVARSKNFDFDGAQRDFQRALEFSRDSSALYVSLGNVQTSEEALKSYTRAIELDKSNTAAFKGRAEIYLAHKEYEKATADLTEAIRLHPQDKELYGLRGEVFSRIDKLGEAVKDLEDGPEKPSLISERAFLKGISRQFDAAMKDFSQSIELDSTAWMPRFLRGIIYFLNGSYRDACLDFRFAAARTPSAEVRSWLYFGEVMGYPSNVAGKNLGLYYSTPAVITEDWRDIVRFLLGQIDEQRLTQSMKPFQQSAEYVGEKEQLEEAKCDTYFAIGMKNQMIGLKVGAKPYWKRCIESKCSSLVSYKVAQAILQGTWQK